MLTEYEKAIQAIYKTLKEGNLYVAINNGRWWKARPNGEMKRWIKNPERFRIPFKYGLKGTGQFTETDMEEFTVDGDETKYYRLNQDRFQHKDAIPPEFRAS